MNIYHVNYCIRYRRNNMPVMGLSAIIIAESEDEAGQIYRKKHNPPTDKLLRITKIGDTNTTGEIWNY